MMSSKRHYLIPGGICELTLRNRSFREFAVYMALKHMCRGQIIITTQVIKEVANALLISSKTVRRCIMSLRNKNRIGFNQASGYSFIRGFDQIRILERIKDRTGYFFDIRKIRQIKGFIVASGYASIVRKMKLRELVKVRKKEKSKQKTSSHFYPIALSYYAKVYNCSASTAARYRRASEKGGFITVKQDLKPLFLHGDLVRVDQLNHLKAYTDDSNSLVVRKGVVYQQLPDRINPILTRKKRPVVMKQKKAK